MKKENELKVAMALHKIVMVVSEEDLNKIGKYVKEVEEAVLKDGNVEHDLKIMPKYFDDVVSGKKNFEIRRNDRDFKVGDILLLREYERGRYTGREIRKKVKYVYYGDGTFGISEEFCIMGLKDGDENDV